MPLSQTAHQPGHISTPDNFSQFLASTLRVGTKLRVCHVSTPPTSVRPIFAAAHGQSEDATTCESHFLAVSQKHAVSLENIDQVAPKPSVRLATTDDRDVLVLGIEILVFSTDSLTTIFVSKADSTGFHARPAAATQGSSSIIKTVIAAFVEWLVSRNLLPRTSEPRSETDPTPPSTGVNTPSKIRIEHENGSNISKRKKLVLSLFARSQNQYLFPGSVENETKHVLDDRQLIKWWCRLLDGLVQQSWAVRIDSRPTNNTTTEVLHEQEASLVSPNAFLVVPGCDKADTMRCFLSTSARSLTAESCLNWRNSFPVDLLKLQNGSKHDTPAAIPIRCMIPRLPDDPKARYCMDLDSAGIDEKGEWRDIKLLQQFWEGMEHRQECAAGRLVGFIWIVFDQPQQNTTELVTNGTAHDASQDTEKSSLGYVPSTDVHLPPDTSHITLTDEQYLELSDLLLNDLDFAGLATAAQSTTCWVEKARELAQVPVFGVDIEGSSTAPFTNQNGHNPTVDSSKLASESRVDRRINVLTGVRKKKRKMDESEHESADREARVDQPPRLDDGSGSQGDGAKLLSAELVRKKPKV